MQEQIDVTRRLLNTSSTEVTINSMEVGSTSFLLLWFFFDLGGWVVLFVMSVLFAL